MRLQTHLTRGKLLGVIIGLTILLSISFLIALAWGSQPIPLGQVLTALMASIIGKAQQLSPENSIILFQVRIPRALFAIAAGAALSVAGAALQALLRNPLAEPYVLGVSSGAALGAILALIFADTIAIGQPLGASIGAGVTILGVYFLGQSGKGTSTERLILAGVITTSFLWAAIIFLLTVANTTRLRGIAFWLMGDLSGGNSQLLTITLIINGLSIAILLLFARALNLLMVGEESAASLGVSVEKVKLCVYLLASLLTGATVAVAGSIGYVGLIVPHIIRMAWSSDNRLLLPASALLGASVVLIADTLARTLIAPRELPVGAITALLGAPLFIYLLRRTL